MGQVLESDIILKVSNLSKRYGKFTAVKNLNLEVKKGEIFGFLGPNGAGKTTTINMICGLLKPTGGEIIISGVSQKNGATKDRRLIGVCPQNIVIWEMLTCIEQLQFAGEIYNLKRREAREKGLELLESFGLYEKKDKLARTLSGGMQRRLNIALALVHDPQILILDEPQAGLDPQSRVLVRDYIKSISDKITVILTTHDMDEAERLSDRVAIIDRGELLVLDTPENLKDKIGSGEILEIKVNHNGSERMNEIISELTVKIQNCSFKDSVITLISKDILERLPEIIQILKENAIKVEDMKIRKKTLEDVFISLTGKGLRE